MNVKYLMAGGLMLAASQVTAQQVLPCEWQARADAIVEPWEENTRTFATGDVRLALLDTVEPAAGSYHILVVSPPFGELGDRQCRTVSMSEGVGFSGVDFSSLKAAYDPSFGLVFSLDVRRFDPETSDFVPAGLVFTLNQATGFIGVALQ